MRGADSESNRGDRTRLIERRDRQLRRPALSAVSRDAQQGAPASSRFARKTMYSERIAAAD